MNGIKRLDEKTEIASVGLSDYLICVVDGKVVRASLSTMGDFFSENHQELFRGIGIQNITFNDDGTMTFQMTDGTEYTSESMKDVLGVIFDTAPTENSENAVTSGGVYSAIKAVDDKLGGFTLSLDDEGRAVLNYDNDEESDEEGA